MTSGQGRTVTILGSTGSVGANTVELIKAHNSATPNKFKVIALTAKSNVETLCDQALAVRAEFVALADHSGYARLKERLTGSSTSFGTGDAAVMEAARMNAELVMSSIMGAAGLRPTLAAVARGRTVALANKECLVCAGDLFMRDVRRYGTKLLPVDSEHNAVFQVLETKQPSAIEQVTITASGGPFRTWSVEQMRGVTPAQACKHPNYSMGAKISVDSATLMNKGLELIEAHFLFGTPHERLKVLVHPQQVVHSLVSYIDGSVLAQMASPDMRTPIAFALGYPDRISAPTERLSLSKLAQLTFEEPDLERFPCLGLAQAALENGGAAPTVLNAANEVAVDAFLQRKAGFLDIPGLVKHALDEMRTHGTPPQSVDEAMAIDEDARNLVISLLNRGKKSSN